SYTPTASEIALGYVDLYLSATNIGNACSTVSDTVRIHFNSDLSVSINATAILCEGALSAITASVSGGMPPYQYQWNIGGNSNSINQPSGTYIVQVRDASGQSCIATDS